jgi:hypothetical protein
MKNFFSLSILFILTMVLNVGCAVEVRVEESQSPSTISPESTSFRTATASLTITAASKLSTQSTPLMSTRTPSLMPTKMIPTWTPLATLSSTEAVIFAENLLKNEQDCYLPCWWGIIPGKSLWMETKQFLEQFAEVSYHETFNGSLASAFASFYVSEEWQFSKITHTYYIYSDGMVESIEIDLPWHDELSKYQLGNFLGTYGAPEDVLISTFQNAGKYGLQFSVVIIYYKQGFMAVFPLTETYIDDESVIGCGIDGIASPIGIWSSELGWTYTQVYERFQLNRFDLLIPLDQASEMDSETFYNAFGMQTDWACIKTPVGLWPGQ